MERNAKIQDGRSAYKIYTFNVSGNPIGNRPLGPPNRSGRQMTMNLKDIDNIFGGVNQGRNLWRALVKAALN